MLNKVSLSDKCCFLFEKVTANKELNFVNHLLLLIRNMFSNQSEKRKTTKNLR